MLTCAFSVMSDSAMLWTVAHQAPLSIGLSRREYWNGLLCPFPGDLLDPGIKTASPALANTFFTANTTWEAHLSTPTQLLIS